MKPLYLLLLALMACGFFACTTDYATDTTEISPQPEGNTMDAATFADFTSALVEFDFFDEESMLNGDWTGIEDYRLHLDKEGDFTIDFLTESDRADEDRTTKEIMDLRPIRNWSSSFTPSYTSGDPERFQRWLTDNFSECVYVDLRLAIFENGTVNVSGMKPSAADLEQFPDIPLFNF